MIVSDKNVQDALAYLADDPHPVAVAQYELSRAESKTKEKFAQLYLKTVGSVKERESEVEATAAYQIVKRAENEAVLEFGRHKSRVKAAESIISVWQSENANARAAERVR